MNSRSQPQTRGPRARKAVRGAAEQPTPGEDEASLAASHAPEPDDLVDENEDVDDEVLASLEAEELQTASDDDGLDEAPTSGASSGYSRPSKSALKRDSHALQALGRRLLELPPSQFKGVDMPERLRDALDAYRQTRSFEGKRRQLQYIGKIMRDVDAQPLKEAVAAFDLGHAYNSLALHEAERWRAELLSGDKDVLTRWVQGHPDSDVQRLRALVRSAIKEREQAAKQPAGAPVRSGKAYREIFQFIKEHQAQVQAQAQGQSAQAAPDSALEGLDTSPSATRASKVSRGREPGRDA